MRFPGFCGSSDTSQSPLADNEITKNFYVQPLPQFGKNRSALYPTPGQSTFLSVTDVDSAALVEVNGRSFGVVGTGLYEFFGTATSTLRGTVTQDSNPATITANGLAGNQLFITSGTNGYCYDLGTNTLTQVLTGDATMGGMLDGYFIAFNVVTSRIRLSDLNDGTVWDPTQFATRSTSPDPWKTMIVVQQPAGIWLIGSQTGEVWGDTGAFPFPLAPIPGASFRYGIAAPFARAVGGDRICWLSQTTEGTGQVVMARGYSPQEISTEPVSTAIAGYARASTLRDAEMFSFQMDSNLFFVLTFQQADATWCYNQSTNLWHQLTTHDSVTGVDHFWAPRVHCYAFGKHLVGDRMSGKINILDVTYGSEADGSLILRSRRAPGLFNEQRQLMVRRFQVYLDADPRTISGQGSDPVIMMRSSRNGGKTWHPWRKANIGKIGQYGRRAFVTRWGSGDDWCFEIAMTDPVPWRIIDAFINSDGPSQSQSAA